MSRRGPGTGCRRGGRSRAGDSGPRTHRLDFAPPPRGSSPRRRARCSPDVRGQLGNAEATLAAHLAPSADATRGLTSTMSPWWSVARGWSLTSTTTIRRPDPAGRRRARRSVIRPHRVEEVAATRAISSPALQRPGRPLQRGMWIAQDLLRGQSASCSSGRMVSSIPCSSRTLRSDCSTASTVSPSVGARPPSSWRRAARSRPPTSRVVRSMMFTLSGQRRRHGVDDPGMVDAVNADHMGCGASARRRVATSLSGAASRPSSRRPVRGRRAAAPPRHRPGRDDQHDREMAAKNRHLGVLDVPVVLKRTSETAATMPGRSRPIADTAKWRTAT